MKILELKSNNIKRLKAVELAIDENQNIVMITGKNANGKTSVLDSIWYALGGAKIIPEQPIRNGTEDAKVELDLGEYLVIRTFTENGTYLKVENKEKAKFSNPQQLLDKIIGQLSFDPLEFSRLEPKKQVAELIKLVGVDFSDLDAAKKDLSEDRTFVFRELKELGKIDADILAKAQALANTAPINITELAQQIQTAIEERNQYNQAQESIAQNNAEIKTLEEKIVKLKGLNEQLAMIENTTTDIVELQKQLASAEQENMKITQAVDIIGKAGIIDDKQAKYDNLTQQIADLEEKRNARLSEAKMPIDGLAWNDDSVTYAGVPFEQLSAAEQLKVSMVMAMVSNPTLRVILIRDGSLLDSDNLKVISELASDMDFQVWIEKVDDTGKVGVYIEEGEVKINNYEKDDSTKITTGVEQSPEPENRTQESPESNEVQPGGPSGVSEN